MEIKSVTFQLQIIASLCTCMCMCVHAFNYTSLFWQIDSLWNRGKFFFLLQLVHMYVCMEMLLPWCAQIEFHLYHFIYLYHWQKGITNLTRCSYKNALNPFFCSHKTSIVIKSRAHDVYSERFFFWLPTCCIANNNENRKFLFLYSI